MNWPVGQRVRCDRQGQTELDGKVMVNEAGSIIISCSDEKMIVVGTEENLKRLGWQPVS